MEKIDFVKSDIGKRLKRLRILMGLSQLEVAELMNIRRETIGHWEREDNVPQKICLFLLNNVLDDWEKLIGMSDKL